MKKLLFVLSTVVILSSLTLSSCGDDDHTSWDGGGENINVLDEITDPEFKTRIKTAMSKGSIKTASPDWLTPQEAAVVERLDSYSWGLTDIKGIEYFTGLTYLDVSKNKISSLDLSSNTKLETLRCNANNLTSLNLNSNTELKKLDCWDNKIESLDLSKCVKLEQLDVNRNNLKTLDVSKNTALTFIDCNECNISGALNVSKNTKLLVLRCSENYTISKINLPPSLTTLYCVLNSLTEL